MYLWSLFREIPWIGLCCQEKAERVLILGKERLSQGKYWASCQILQRALCSNNCGRVILIFTLSSGPLHLIPTPCWGLAVFYSFILTPNAPLNFLTPNESKKVITNWLTPREPRIPNFCAHFPLQFHFLWHYPHFLALPLKNSIVSPLGMHICRYIY